jgi:uncharacterized protein (TIGR03083 family)
MTNDAELQPEVAALYLALAELLSVASEAAWNTESLCEGWRVREVVAHMTTPARYSNDEFMEELERYGYDFTRLSNDIASKDGELPAPQLVADLRSVSLHRWVPPGGGYHGALNHVAVHGMDITVPLGEPCLASDEVLRVILDDLTEGGVHERFGIAIDDRRFEATNLDWTYGSGASLRATAQDLALVMCGRKVPTDRLDGAPLRGPSD